MRSAWQSRWCSGPLPEDRRKALPLRLAVSANGPARAGAYRPPRHSGLPRCKKRVVRVESVPLRKIGLVGCHKRHATIVSPAQQLRFHEALTRKFVPLNFDIEAVTEQARQKL